MDPDAIKSSIRKTDDAIRNLTTALSQSMDSPAMNYIIQQISELDKQKKTLESELRKTLLQESANRSAEEEEKEIYQNICYLLDNFEKISYSGKNELIRKIIKKCVYDGNNMRIIF